MPNHDDILRLEGISKAYPGVKALDNVGFSLKKGEVHALVGENGAGKSTLIKCISGAIRPDSGKIFLDNKEFLSIGPKDTIEHGIVTVYQELNLIPSLSVAENVFVGERRGGKLLYNRQKVERECKKILEDFHIDIDATAIVSELSVAQRQLVEIVRAISRNVRILILDEPTSSLTVHETQFLFDTIRRLKQNGVTIIYISHIFEETFALADRITVMRDGRYIDTLETAKTNKAELIKLMVGRDISDSFPVRNVSLGDVVLKVENMTAPGVENISFDLRRGEILGFAGLVGAGRTELMNAIYGASEKSEGTITIKGKLVNMKSPHDGIRFGLGMIPEDRKLQGIFLRANVLDNISSANLKNLTRFGLMRDKSAARIASEFRDKLRIKTPSLSQLAQNLSGGNQQKVAVAKALAPNPEILIFDEPTRGIDVGAKQEIYKLMDELVAQGHSILMVSSEMVELMGMADRIIVLANHRKAGELTREQFSQEAILTLASDETPKAV
ncbi:MAG: sugar ABC transporter ATP-binding protein [Acutalibacteraceae bacterium]